MPRHCAMSGGLTSRRMHSGAAITLARERKVQWLLALRHSQPDVFADLPDDRVDVTESQRAALDHVYGRMIDAGFYARPQASKWTDRLFGLRALIGEARSRPQ